ncbi:LysR family transcriptional regulator [Halomonas sp. KAO]|uniref:LysR substrate-binding domain-containing protein n=1 Tax=Halomonas sp. KAO TaxID=2783858 RepID=UPI00189FE7F3|nr:LysR substrate-binding domain-containing protein [Halomonas sp. KAO]MBF7054654.1 LysR family transcriptional regulator [Halomonas sp. KAO]
MKISPLPPLNSLVAFESAARHLSFTLAAKELHVTQGAISRQVRGLEDYLGKPLFERANRSVKLTAMGQRYAQAVRQSLADISAITDEVRSWHGMHQLTVATTSAMASLWLLPKIPRFQREHDDIELRIVATEQLRDLSRVESDVALFYCRTPPASMHATTLFHEEVFPVCSPGYLERYGPFEGPEALLDCTLLSLEDADQDWMSWKQWFSQVGVASARAPRRRLNINSYSMLVQAAMMDQGVALGWSQLVDDYLVGGHLVRPVETVLRTEARFCLLERSEAPAHRWGVRAFREWLLETFPKEVGDLGLT